MPWMEEWICLEEEVVEEEGIIKPHDQLYSPHHHNFFLRRSLRVIFVQTYKRNLEQFLMKVVDDFNK